MKENRWDCQSVFCIKEYKTIKSGGYYLIKGRGDLEFNCDPEINDRKGYGFCIEDSFYGSFSGITSARKKCQNTLFQKKKI